MESSAEAKKVKDDLFAGLDFDNIVPTTKKSNVVDLGHSQQGTPKPIGNTLASILVLAKSGYAKMILIEKELNELFLEREDAIKDMLRAIVVGQSVLLLGPPGTGKSAMTNEVCARIVGAKYFAWLLNKTSDPAELLGPYSLKDMERDKFRRKTEGKLPEAHIAFIDECYKSNEPTLNILLPILNEKKFFNDGLAVDIPLISMFCASNEGPEDDSLLALHDRLLFRHNVQPIRDASNIEKMFDNYLERRSGVSAKAYSTITLDEIKAMDERSKSVTVSKNIKNTLIKLLGVMNREAVIVSERRKNECLKILQGNAVMNDRDAVVLDDFTALIHVLWEKEEDIPTIEGEIAKLINPYDDKIKNLMGNFKQIKDNLVSIKDPTDKCRASIEAKGALESIVGKFENVIKEANKNGKDTTDMVKTKDEIILFNTKIMEEALGLNFAASGMDAPF